jgi:hypothetical protein
MHTTPLHRRAVDLGQFQGSASSREGLEGVHEFQCVAILHACLERSSNRRPAMGACEFQIGRGVDVGHRPSVGSQANRDPDPFGRLAPSGQNLPVSRAMQQRALRVQKRAVFVITACHERNSPPRKPGRFKEPLHRPGKQPEETPRGVGLRQEGAAIYVPALQPRARAFAAALLDRGQ